MKGRRTVQFLSFLALNAGSWLQLKWLCPQWMWCHACPMSVTACPIGVIGYYTSLAVVPIFAIGLLLAVGATIGRFLCGWVCPFGFLQDILYKIPVRKFKLPEWTRYIKYVMLIFMVFIVAIFLGQNSILYYCKTCPVATFSATIPRAISTGHIVFDNITVFRLAYLGILLIVSSMVSRPFCRVLCPVAALVAPLNEGAATAVRLNQDECNGCGVCTKKCPMNLDPRTLKGATESRLLTRTECISCTECINRCPKNSLKLGI